MSQVRSAAPAVDRPVRPAAPRGGGRLWWELAVLVPLAIALVVRRSAYLLSHSLWVDEGWVADSVRAPLHQLPLLTSSTPLGWTLLLRLVPPIGGPQYLRLLPLAFVVASVLPAWWLGRRLDQRFGCTVPLHGMAAGLLGGLAVASAARRAWRRLGELVVAGSLHRYPLARLRAGPP